MSSQRGNQSSSGLLDLARLFNRFYFGGLKDGRCTPVVCQGKQIGLVRDPTVTEAISNFSDLFRVTKDEISILWDGYEGTSKRFGDVLQTLRDSHHDFVPLRSWRDEAYDVREGGMASNPLFKVERAATPMFGFHQYGVDVNGYVDHPTDGLCIWLQRRAKTKPTWPGRWDNLVSGGITAGIGVRECAVKEAGEEANVSPSVAKRMVSSGCVTFFFESDRGVFPETEFVFDLELPLDFRPANNDGEVDEFALVPAKELPSRICQPDMKTTSCPVLLDFLVRKGIINADNEPDLVEITELMHLPIHTFYTKTTS